MHPWLRKGRCGRDSMTGRLGGASLREDAGAALTIGVMSGVVVFTSSAVAASADGPGSGSVLMSYRADARATIAGMRGRLRI
jgi:hypothetical protein